MLLLKTKSDSGCGFSKNFESGSGSEVKEQKLAGVDSGSVATSAVRLSACHGIRSSMCKALQEMLCAIH